MSRASGWGGADDLLEMAILVALPDAAFGTETFFSRRACLSPGVRPFKQLRIAAAALDSHPVALCFQFRFDVPNHDVPTFRSTMFVFHGIPSAEPGTPSPRRASDKRRCCTVTYQPESTAGRVVRLVGNGRTALKSVSQRRSRTSERVLTHTLSRSGGRTC